MEAMPSTESTRLSPMYVGQVGRVDNKMTESRGVTVEAKMREKKRLSITITQPGNLQGLVGW